MIIDGLITLVVTYKFFFLFIIFSLLIFIYLAKKQKEWIVTYEVDGVRVSRIFISFRDTISVPRLRKSLKAVSDGEIVIIDLKQVRKDMDYTLN